MEDLVGKKFKRLFVVKETDPIIEESGKAKIAYFCKCDCGNELVIKKESLGKVGSCGCWATESRSKLGLSHRKYEPHIASARDAFKKRYNDGDLTFEDFYKLSQMNCFYCGIMPSNNYNKFLQNSKSKISQFAKDNGEFLYNGLDRIDSSLPHNKDNCVTACFKCNRAKFTMSQEDFKNLIEAIYNNWVKV